MRHFWIYVAAMITSALEYDIDCTQNYNFYSDVFDLKTRYEILSFV